MDIRAYYAVFVPEVNGQVSVWFPDVPGCQTWGENMEHAFAQAIEVLESHLEVLIDDDDPIPAPLRHEEVLDKVRRDFETEGETKPQDAVLQLVPVPDLQEKP